MTPPVLSPNADQGAPVFGDIMSYLHLDWDGNGVDDIVAGIPEYDGTAGRLYVVLLTKHGEHVNNLLVASSTESTWGTNVEVFPIWNGPPYVYLYLYVYIFDLD